MSRIPHPLDRLPEPQPDFDRLKTAILRRVPDRVPLIELAIAEEVLAALADGPLPPSPSSRDDTRGVRAWADARVKLWWRLGYDYYRVRAEIPFYLGERPNTVHAHRADAAQAAGQVESAAATTHMDPSTTLPTDTTRQWMNEHRGVIVTREDAERYPWPGPAEIDFAPAEAAITCLRDGMGAIGFSGGVLEWASTLMGLEHFMISLRTEPDLVREVVDRVGQCVLAAFERFCRMDAIRALWLGDDMGFKTSTLISPRHLREYILPWHRRYVELAHSTGRLFLLHSCGHVESVMPDLICDVGIDAKHSFEDAVVPVERFKASWGEQVSVLGGVDVDLLSRGSPDDVRRRTREILGACAPTGGYACGSGNSITNYVPVENYLAMVETVHRFNGR